MSFPETAQEAIFSRMRADREFISQEFRARRAAEADRIKALADGERIVIQAEARSRADAIQADGEAKVLGIFIEAMGQVSELSRYQRSLEAYKAS